MTRALKYAAIIVAAAETLVLGQGGDAVKVLADARAAMGGDKLAAVKTMTGMEAFDAFGSGSGGGIYRRGDTVEGQMMTNLQTLTTAVQNTSDSVKLLHQKIQGDTSDAEPNASEGGSSWFSW